MQLDRMRAREEPAIRLNDEIPYSFVVLFVPCLVLSARFDTVHLGIGVICASQVAYWHELLSPQMVESDSTLEKEL